MTDDELLNNHKAEASKVTIDNVVKKLLKDESTSEKIAALKKEFSEEQYLIGIAGNIGVGKSTLANILSRILECESYEELDNPNPYLKNFYVNPKKWAYKSQMFFLNEKAKKMKQISRKKESAIIDRTIYEDINVFARAQREFRYINIWQWTAYKIKSLWQTINLPYPEVMIYLRGNPQPTLWERINERKRPEETEKSSKLDVEYLHLLNGLYELMAYSLKKNKNTHLCIINTDYTRQEIISQRSKEEVIGRVAEKSVDFLYNTFIKKQN